jgi:hypothetical protein
LYHYCGIEVEELVFLVKRGNFVSAGEVFEMRRSEEVGRNWKG